MYSVYLMQIRCCALLIAFVNRKEGFSKPKGYCCNQSQGETKTIRFSCFQLTLKTKKQTHIRERDGACNIKRKKNLLCVMMTYCTSSLKSNKLLTKPKTTQFRQKTQKQQDSVESVSAEFH